MKKIEISNVLVDGDTIHYRVIEEAGIGLLRKDTVDLFIRFHFSEEMSLNLESVPQSILLLPLSLYILPITYFYNVELVIPEMDKVLFENLPSIYEAYSKIYGPFKESWRGKVTVQKVVENKPVENPSYVKIVFFSGGVDACHAGINNPGKKSLLVSIPDIEAFAKNDGPLREEKFSLIKNFSKIVDSDWLLISNNFNDSLFRDAEIYSYLRTGRHLCSSAYEYDGWAGIKYMANMCSVAPIAYLTGVKQLVMGSTFEQIESKLLNNEDGASPELSDAIKFVNIEFSEQDGLTERRTRKVKRIIDWCKAHKTTTKLWACFQDGDVQCGFCMKCVRTQLNILCAGENPRDWGFDNFSEKELTDYVKSYCYRESNPCWLWDNIESIQDNKKYQYCNDLLHWLKKIGYKKYTRRANMRTLPGKLKRILNIEKYPHYIKMLYIKLTRDK